MPVDRRRENRRSTVEHCSQDGCDATIPGRAWGRSHAFSLNIKGSIPPPIGAQEGRGEAMVVYVHYLIGGYDWYLTEMDPPSHRAYGFQGLSQGHPEWGYIGLEELGAVLAPPLKLPVEHDLVFELTLISKLRGRQ
ncbi:DUF2958 domain-containing protein [Streptomyces sp. NPDC006984]|uniref:DUF2958 domain-containing protein n=1 Tax=Streptomyces sp. NPDC006984 TaxID=3155463 RepID=UPI003407E0C1